MILRILVMARSNAHSSAKANLRWELFEIVDVFEAFETPAADGSPAFYRVYITDWPTSLQAAKTWLLEDYPQAKRKRLLDDIPVGFQNSLTANGFIEISTNQLKAWTRQRPVGNRDGREADTGAPV